MLTPETQIQAWFNERCALAPSKRRAMISSSLYADYRRYAEGMGWEAADPRSWGAVLVALGYPAFSRTDRRRMLVLEATDAR